MHFPQIEARVTFSSDILTIAPAHRAHLARYFRWLSVNVLCPHCRPIVGILELLNV